MPCAAYFILLFWYTFGSRRIRDGCVHDFSLRFMPPTGDRFRTAAGCVHGISSKCAYSLQACGALPHCLGGLRWKEGALSRCGGARSSIRAATRRWKRKCFWRTARRAGDVRRAALRRVNLKRWSCATATGRAMAARASCGRSKISIRRSQRPSAGWTPQIPVR